MSISDQNPPMADEDATEVSHQEIALSCLFDQITHNSDLNCLIRSESTTVLAEEDEAIVLFQ